MYKQMYLVPPHIYSNIKKCINSVDEMSDLVESNQNIQPDYFTDVINNEKKPHAPKSDVNNSSATSALQNSTLNTTSNDVNGILPQYNLSQPGNNSLSNEKKKFVCPRCGMAYQMEHHFINHLTRFCKKRDNISTGTTLESAKITDTSTPLSMKKPVYNPAESEPTEKNLIEIPSKKISENQKQNTKPVTRTVTANAPQSYIFHTLEDIAKIPKKQDSQKNEIKKNPKDNEEAKGFLEY